MLIYVWAQDQNGLIGRERRLPWHLPNDLQFFKEVTLGQTIVMGRATFDGMGKRLLPKRHTIVLTTQVDYDANGAEVVNDVQTILEDSKEEDLYIVGGTQLFEAFKNEVDVLYCTKIEGSFEGDTYFPQDFPWERFTKVKSIEGTRDEKNQYAHTFEIYQRKGSVQK